jgi:hypothetical protein
MDNIDHTRIVREEHHMYSHVANARANDGALNPHGRIACQHAHDLIAQRQDFNVFSTSLRWVPGLRSSPARGASSAGMGSGAVSTMLPM